MLRRNFSSILYLLLLLSLQIWASLNIDELQKGIYNLDLGDKPFGYEDVKDREIEASLENDQETIADDLALPESSVILSNSRGQQFVCEIPEISPTENSDSANEEDGNNRNATNEEIFDLLALSFSVKRCLKKTAGWWTYEVCFNREVQQYRLNDKQIEGDVISLGFFANNVPVESSEDEKPKKRQKYLAQNYEEGSLCELSSKLRKTEVRFYCDEELAKADAYIYRIDEPLTCQYLITIHVGSLCKLRQFRPPNRPPPPKNILCQPLLSAENTQKYVQRQLDAEYRVQAESDLLEQFKKVSRLERQLNELRMKKMMKAMHQNENPYADRNLDFEAYSMLYGKPFLDMISRKDFDMDFLDSDEDLFDEATESQLFLDEHALERSEEEYKQDLWNYFNDKTKGRYEFPIFKKPEPELPRLWNVETETEKDVLGMDSETIKLWRLDDEFYEELEMLQQNLNNAKKRLSKTEFQMLAENIGKEYAKMNDEVNGEKSVEEAWERIQQQRKEYQEFRRENSHDQAAIEQYESRLESKIESLFDEQAEKYVAERLQNKRKFESIFNGADEEDWEEFEGGDEVRNVETTVVRGRSKLGKSELKTVKDKLIMADSDKVETFLTRLTHHTANAKSTDEEMWKETGEHIRMFKTFKANSQDQDAIRRYRQEIESKIDALMAEDEEGKTDNNAEALEKAEFKKMFRKMLDQLDAISDGEKLEDSSAADADDGQYRLQVDSETRRLEGEVTDKLKKAGFDPNDQIVKIRVVTSGDQKLEEFRDLNAQESERFSDFIVSMMGANNEQMKEEKRLRKTEKNFEFEWNHNDDDQGERKRGNQ